MHMQFDRHICVGACAKNVECLLSSVSGHIFDCNEFICGKYTDIVALHMYIKSFAFMANMWHLRNIFVDGTYIAIAW